MILTDREIKIYIERKLIVVDPTPLEEHYASTSLDLTLDPVISLFNKENPGIERVLDPSVPGFKNDVVINSLTTRVVIDKNEGYVLRPHMLILGWTKQYVDLGDARVAARVEGKSGLARLGLTVHMTAPILHAGFEGQIRLEVVNHGELPIRLKPDMRICQLVFEQTLGTPDKGYRGQFARQKAG